MFTVLYNTKKIESVLENFHTLTEIPVCLYDKNFNAVAYAGFSPDYCCQIRQNSTLDTKCNYPDKIAARKSAEQSTFITYTCHAGLAETVAPLFFDNVILGYILFGGFRDKSRKISNANTVNVACEKYNLDKDKYLCLYKKIESFDDKKLKACTELLNICLKYIISEKYINIDNSIIASKIIAYLDEHYHEDITFEHICHTFNIGKNFLYKTIKKQTGCTVNNYIITVRMKNAKKLLEQTDKPITEIASLVGFYDYNYFIRMFKRHFQTTPLKYRKTFESSTSTIQ